MKKYISLMLSFLLIISVFPSVGMAADTETKIWFEDFEGDNPLSAYTTSADDGEISVISSDAFGGKALKITGGTKISKIEKNITATWTSDTGNNIVASFDFMLTGTGAYFYIVATNSKTNFIDSGNSPMSRGYLCSIAYIDGVGYTLLKNHVSSSNMTADANRMASVSADRVHNLTIVLGGIDTRVGGYFTINDASGIYLDGVKVSGFEPWDLPGFPIRTIPNLNFNVSGGTVYMDNIELAHYTHKNLACEAPSVINEVNPYNPIEIPFDNYLKSKGTVSLKDKDGRDVAASADIKGRYLVLKPEAPLSFDSSYTLAITGAVNMHVATAENKIINTTDATITLNTIKERCTHENKTVKSYELEEIRVLLDKSIDSSALSQISLSSPSGAAPTGEIALETVNGSIYLVVPIEDNLKCGEQYSLSLKAISGFEAFEDVRFNVDSGINVTKPQFSGTAVGVGNTLNPGVLSCTVTTDSDIPTTALMLLYYKGTKLVGVSCKTISASDDITANITISDTTDCYVKAYVVEGLGTMKPLTKSITIGR